MANIELELEIETADRGIQAALLEEVLVDLNNRPGYSAQPARGDILTVLATMAQNAIDNKELLAALFGSAKVALDVLKIRVEAKKPKSYNLTLEVDGATLKVETPDLESGEKLLEKFTKAHPATAAKVTAKSKAKVKGSITA